jgi:predicted DCC family thiol-disulfide oxidoreductase YuxK
MAAAQGWVLYDGECSLCTKAARRCQSLLRRSGFQVAALQTASVGGDFGTDEHGRPTEMIVALPDGRTLGGADGIVQIARRVWWAWPVFALAQIPGMMVLLRAVYRYVAAKRTCNGNACELPQERHMSDWLVLAVLPILVLATQPAFPAWVFMWLMALSLYFGCKWLTWRRGMRRASEAGWFISFGYLFGWVGMDAKRFLSGRPAEFKLKWNDWFWPVANTLTGVALIWLAVRQVVGPWPIAAGWVGMVGVILCLHFGSFQLLALAWQRAGVNAVPLMREPWRAVSLTEFWGQRWNGAFHDLANSLMFRPLLRKCGPIGATLVVFLVSGLIHDLIISVPARGGYGLPTAYFLIQGLAMVFERTTVARKIGLGHGWRGWLFMVICTACPAYWLFHPTFIRNIILPMFQALGAT